MAGKLVAFSEIKVEDVLKGVPILDTTVVSGKHRLVTSTGSTPAGTALMGDVGLQARPNATGAATVAKVTAAATTNATLVKAAAGRVLGYHFSNTSAAVKVVRFYDLAVAPTVGTSVPIYVVSVPANGHVSVDRPIGIAHNTGISYAITGAIPDLDATVTAANDVLGAIFYS